MQGRRPAVWELCFWAFFLVVLGGAAVGIDPLRSFVRVAPVVLIGPPVVLLLYPLVFRRWSRPLPDAGEQSRRTDAAHVILTPAVIILCTLPFAVAATVAMELLGWEGPLHGTPLALQIPAAVLAVDFVGYWGHRLLHTVPALWRVHRVHHSTTHFHWRSDARFNPVEGVVMGLINLVPLLLLGLGAGAAIAVAVLQKATAVTYHANVPLAATRLDRVFVTPRFHRWHHGLDADAHDANYGQNLSIWDGIFGTRYQPEGRLPSSYGIPDAPAERWIDHMLEPIGLARLVGPFRRPVPATPTI